MTTKADVQKALDDAKAAADRAKAAEDKIKALEAEKADMIAKGYGGGGGGRPSFGGGSDEARALLAFGCGHVKELVHVNVGHPRFKQVPDSVKGVVMRLKESVDIARWIGQMFHGDPQDVIGKSEKEDRIAHAKAILESNFARSELVPRLKAFGSTISGAGDEWVPTLVSSQYIEEYELAHLLEARFQSIPMPSNPFNLPVQNGVTRARIVGENQAQNNANFGTTNLAFSAVKLGEFYILPEELDEDSAPSFMPIARMEVTKAQTRAYETAIVNGDDDGTHIDTDTQAAAADLAEKAWKGLRRQALANSAAGATIDFGNAKISDANLRTMRERMKKHGVNERELIWIPSSVGYLQMLGTDNVVTVEKFGPQATILQGALAAYGGIPIVTSEFLRLDMNATGVHDGVTTTRTGLLLVNHRRWYRGIRRPIRVKVMPDLAQHDRWQLASYSRTAFTGHAQSAAEVSVAYGYNVAQ